MSDGTMKYWLCLVIAIIILSNLTLSKRRERRRKKNVRIFSTTEKNIKSFTRTLCLDIEHTLRGTYLDTAVLLQELGTIFQHALISLQAENNKFTFVALLCAVVLFYLSKQKACFLRPDTGPCRADILQYYYDVKLSTCYKFFWGGCQGNGNRFETKKECYNNCYLNGSYTKKTVPNYCSLSFDYGTCFGYYYRWYWDSLAKSCKRRLYSGCGGNQNNFETRDECYANCLTPPLNSMNKVNKYTTCLPYILPGVE